MNNFSKTVPQLLFGLAAALAAAFAATALHAASTTISTVPLATASGANILPNLLFTLDTSGSMASDYLPDYVNDSQKCMTTSSPSTTCSLGDPPYRAGGVNGFNGVAYDPNVYYRPALDPTGKAVVNWTVPTTATAAGLTLTTTAVVPDAFLGGSTVNIETGTTDRRYCNSNNVCKRNGADSGGTNLVAGSDYLGHTMSAGRFPYRTNGSNSSTTVFGLPEMMSIGAFVRAGTTVTVTTIAAHGLAVNDVIYVTGTGTMDGNVFTVTAVTANTFTYTHGSSGASSKTGSFRKHTAVAASGAVPAAGSQGFAKVTASTTVTVVSTAHGLITNDVVFVNSGNAAFVEPLVKNVTVVDANTFTYVSTTGNSIVATTAGTWVRTGLYNVGGNVNGPPVTYFMTPVEYCTDANLTNCQEVIPPAAPPSGFTFPAYMRFCQTQEQALAPGGVGDASGTPRCRNKFVGSGTTTWQWPRYGWFNRDTIQPSVANYANRPSRGDCVAAPVCTYAEEMQNYARWLTYYSTRIQMMKTAAGRAFLPFVSDPSHTPVPIPDKVRVGFITIEPFYTNVGNSTQQSTVQASKYLKIDNFNTTQSANWYDKFYKQVVSQSTPLREALSRAGWIFAGKLNTGLTAGIPLADDPVQNSCQRNYTLLTTDGYWNGGGGIDLHGDPMGNADNVSPLVVSPYTSVMVDRTTTGTFDGGKGTVVTTTTPTNVTEQSVCFGNGNTSFGSGTQQACGCSGTQQRLWTRTSGTSQVVSTTDGVQTSNTTAGPTTIFTPVTACTAATVNTATSTGTTIVEEQMVTGNATSTFPIYGTPTTGANQAGTCAANSGQILRRTTTINSSVVTTNGVAGAPSYVPGTTSYVIAPQGSCAVLTKTDTYSVTEIAQYIVPGLGNPATAQSSAFGAPANSPPQTNPQNSYSCRSGRSMRVQRNLTYTKTIVTVGAGAPTTTYSANTAGPTFSTVDNCAGSGVGAAATTLVTPTLTSSITSGAPTPATTVTTPGAVTNVASGPAALVVTQSPNPSAATVGAAVVTTTPGGYADTLADTAMYYYRTDLRGGTDMFNHATGPALNGGGAGTVDVSANNIPVKTGAKDFVTAQHMVTFTIGMADGFMRYQSDYENATTGDFANIKNGAAAGTCFWTTGVCNWPQPIANDASALDDLWHAGVNGRGQFYSALNVDALVNGISNTLNAVGAQVAAAAASATSSPNVTQTDNQIFSTTYETNTWAGKVFAQTIDPNTGNVGAAIQWQADSLLVAKVAAGTRRLFTLDLAVGNTDQIKPFIWGTGGLNATEKAYFSNKCVPATTMTQCSGLTGTPLANANDGSQMLDFLSGKPDGEITLANPGGSFRDRAYIDLATNNITQTVLGDTISAKPAYVRGSTNNYTVPSNYTAFVTRNSTRSPRVYVGANDGFLHAFNALTGDEAWAYAPNFLLPSLYQLADTGYAGAHRYFVDGSPETADVFDVNATAPASAWLGWKTILVGGLAGGGAGFYAIDITDPDNPKGLWEFCASASLCAVSDTDLGLSYGNPIIGKRSYDGRWVVILTSGLNNTTGPNPGIGYFYVLDAITGAKLDKVPITFASAATPPVLTPVGTATTPAGLMKMSAYFDNAVSDPTFRYVYAGDQLGNVWRLDMNAAPTAPAPVLSPAPAPVVLHLATLTDASTPARAQPITTRPTLTHIGTDRIVYVGTGRFLGVPDLTDPGSASGISWQQSLYAFKDKGTDYGTAGLRTDSNMFKQTLTLTSLGATTRTITANTTPVTFAAPQNGWYVDFNPTFSGVGASPGEGVNLVDPKLVLGTLVVTTNAPSQGSSSCSVGGSSFAYNFDFKTGLAVSSSAGGVVGSSLGGTITVGVAIVQLPSGAIKSINTGADTSKTTENVNTSASGASVKRFSYRTR